MNSDIHIIHSKYRILIFYKKYEKWHRIDGPAYLEYNLIENKLVLIEEQWAQNDKINRINGPASLYINFDKNERIEKWWIDGKDVTAEVEEWFKENNITYPFNEEEEFLFKMSFL